MLKQLVATSIPLIQTICAGADEGDVLWRFETFGRTIQQFVTVGPDGTIYTADNVVTYALTPEGVLRWTTGAAASRDGAGGRPISIGPDGTIYTGVGIVGDSYAAVVALDPQDGSTVWEFLPPNRDSILTGPNVGPDGNIYASQDSVVNEGLGVFSLDPDGNLRWANPGDPLFGYGDWLLSNSDIEFGVDRLHTGIVRSRSGGNPVIYTFTLDGQQLWQTYDLRPHITDQPALDPTNRLILTWGQTGMRALSPDAVEEWFLLHPDGASLVRRPAIDADGVIYSGDMSGVDLWAINPNGTTRWVLPSESNAGLRTLGISPDGRVIVACGVANGIGWIRGYSPEDGELLWQVDLPPENNLPQLVSNYEPAFTADSTVAYVTTQFAGNANEFGYVYAIEIGDPSGAAPLTDFAVVLGQWLAGDLESLRHSDNVRLRVRSGPGFNAMEPNLLDIRIGAAAGIINATTIDLTIEGRLNQPGGAARLRLRNWSTNQFEQVHQYAIGTVESVEVKSGISAMNRIRQSDGRIELSMRQSILATFSVIGFDSFTDHVGMDVQ